METDPIRLVREALRSHSFELLRRLGRAIDNSVPAFESGAELDLWHLRDLMCEVIETLDACEAGIERVEFRAANREEPKP